MGYLRILWDLDDDEAGNVQHIAQHGLTKEDVEGVLEHPVSTDASRSSGRPIALGITLDGRFIGVVYEEIDDMTIYPVTAFEVEE
ncbi:MAG: hypothetical protein WD847_21050 [Pirellulales bacterium]